MMALWSKIVQRLEKFGWANCLTLFRVVAVPFYILFFVLHLYPANLILFGLVCLSDLFDGTVARLTRLNSKLGAVLDPIADKTSMLTIFVSLTFAEVVPWWFIVVVLSRDVVVVIGFIFVKVNQIPIPYRALWSSKIATFFEMAAGGVALTYLASPEASIGAYPVGDLVFGSVLIASILILVATMQYLKLGLHLIELRYRKKSS